jgi:type IV pilus assembly protein PilB
LLYGDLMAERKKLGILLKEAGLIDEYQLAAALSHQHNWGGKLGSIIVDLEFAREEDIARIISETMGVPYVNLFEPEISPDVIRLLKADIAKKFDVIPVKKESTNTLVLAMSDPFDIATMDNIRFVTGLTIKPVLSMASEIKDAIRKYYDGETVIRKDAAWFRDTAKLATQLEIVREVPSIATTERNQQAQQQDPQSVQQEIATQKTVLDALISILIEKDIITRGEIAKFIEQKKLGL